MKRNKLLLLISSLGTLALLAWAATEEHFLSDWHQSQQEYKGLLSEADASGFSVQLRQVVVPALKVTDRCISCHLGMAPGETPIEGHPVFAAHPQVVHDPAEFGCTVCHGGQGRATATEDAHGTVDFWPEPMIPSEMADAGCGSCHTHLSVPDAARLDRGQLLFERNDCLACHGVDGRGGTLRPFGAAAVTGPELSLAGARGYDQNWYAAHLARSGDTPAWSGLFTPINEEDRAAIKAYLDSRVGAPDLIEGKAAFHSLGCRGCHPVHGVGGVDGPALDTVGQKDPGQLDFTHVKGHRRALHAWLAEHFRAPAKIVQGSQMPYLGLSEDSIEKLTLYMLSLRQSTFPEAYWPKDRIQAEFMQAREFATDGETLYGTFCAACHGDRGQGMRYLGMTVFPAIANPDFLSLASDDFISSTITRGRPGRRMPAWNEAEGGLRPEEIERLVLHLRRLGGDSRPEADPRPRRWVQGNPEEGQRLYAANCAQCHGPRGLGGEGPSLANPVLLETATDTYLVETVLRGRRGTTMPSFRTSSPVHSRLTEEEVESLVTYIRTWENEQ